MLSYTRTRFHEVRLRLEHHIPTSRLNAFLWEFFLFGFKQAWACLFGGIILGLVLITKIYWPPHARLARYDFLFLAALTIQVLLLILRMETIREAKVILVFHLVGTLMELFKTSVGSWTYPENSLIRIGHVPLFSGFMYSSVGSYLARITRILDMRYTRYPGTKVTATLALLIYINFFAHHFLPDVRVLLFLFVAAAFGAHGSTIARIEDFTGCPCCWGSVSSRSLSGELKISGPSLLSGSIRINETVGSSFPSENMARGCF